MTSQSPRIYTYKITFEEVPYYYYGMHEEKIYGEEYWGSPKTHKWCWELYTPKKQILETFSSRKDAGEVERRLIKPVYNTDKWCLNANCAGVFSLDICSKAGKIAVAKNKKNKVGIFGRSKEKMSEDGRKGAKASKGYIKGRQKIKELGLGVYGLTAEQRKENGKKYGAKAGKIGGKKTYEMKLGLHGRTKEQKVEDARKGGLIGGKKTKELNSGIFALTSQEKAENARKGHITQKELGLGLYGIPKEKRIKTAKKTNSQRWECCETGYVSTPAGLTKYQKARNIDTSKRRRIS
jgi:hypothetical protein